MGSMPGEMVSASPSDVLENYQNVYTLTGTNHSIAAARISYVFGLTGPCAVYSAACSSSLIALHSVVRSLGANDCEMAIVLGVNAILSCRGHLSVAICPKRYTFLPW